MKKFLTILGYTVLGAAALLYISFLFILPNVVDINKFKPEIQKIVQEQAKLNINFENAKIITTPLLGAGIKADNITIKLPDDSLLFSADSLKTRVAIPSIFLLTVKVSAFEVNNPYVNLEIANNEQFKVIQLVEYILNRGKEQALEKTQTEIEEKGWFNPAWIRIKIPCVKLNNYKVLVNDLESNHYLKLQGERLTAGYFNGKTMKIKTYAELFSDENKNITADINIDTFLPPPAPALDEEDDPAERIDIPFVNPVTMYRNYDLKANFDTSLRVREDLILGYFNLEDITMKVSHLVLPPSYLKAKCFGKTIKLDTNIYAAENQNIQAEGSVAVLGKPSIDMKIKTGDIKFNDMIILTKAFLDSLHIRNELADITATGMVKADCYIKTNLKKLKSSGSIIVKDGGVNVKRVGKVLADANINLLLDNNMLQIQDSSLLVNNSKVNIDGKIDQKSVADISIAADKIPLPVLFNAFAPQEMRNAYNFKSGDMTLKLNLEGKLKKAVASLQAGLSNLNLQDKAGNLVIQNQDFFGEFFCNSKEITGEIENENLTVAMPKTGSSIRIPEFEIKIEDKNIEIEENSLFINDKSSIKFSGNIEDYNKLKSINLTADGNLDTGDLIKLIGTELKPFIHSAGVIPVKITVDGNKNKQTLYAQALSSKENFITPVDMNELQGKNISLQSVIDFKANRIKIKKTGFFERIVNVDEKGNEIVTLDEIFGIDGTIEGNRINLIKITMPKYLNGKIYAFPQSEFKFGGRAFVLGETAAPRMRGGFTIQSLSVPELLLDLRNGALKFKGNHAELTADDLILNGSDLQIDGTISLIPASVLNITDLDVSSRYFNVDKVMKVSEKAMAYVPQSPAGKSSQSAETADIPVVIQNGSINFARIISGNIDIRNTTGRISLADNIFRLRNLRTNIFDGQVNGNISMNLLSSLLNINVRGRNINTDKALIQAANMKDTLKGTAVFNADISLKGATYEEQMRSLKGNVDFTVKNGQFGPFGKIENLILAENIRESQFFQTALGGIIDGLLTIDTTHFSDLSGNLSFNDGICYLDPITSLGDILSLHIFGEFDILRNYADMKVRARMASLVSNLLGPLGAINPANLINSAASLNIVTAKAFSLFCEMVPEEELETLPSFANSYVDNAATKFQLVVRGDAAKPLTLVKSFKWLASKTEYDNAVDYVNSIPEPIEGSEATTIEEIVAEHEAEKQTLRYKIKHLFSKDTEETVEQEVQQVTSPVEETEEVKPELREGGE